MAKIDKVSIKLQSNVYTTFRALNSTIYHAVGEFIDNAIQSYIDHKEEIKKRETDYKLRIDILFDLKEKRIIVEDNAAGIDEKNYTRAFEPAHIPTDAKGLHEFGMGMKTAAVWLSDTWTVVTKAYNEKVERTTTFDLKTVVSNDLEEMSVKERAENVSSHYTKIEMTNLFEQHAPNAYILPQIKKNLGSTYRTFLRRNDIEILVNGDPLVAPKYGVLKAAYYKNENGKIETWKKEINLIVGPYKISGFIAILDKIQKGANGLVLMRRGRGIIGADETKYMPPCIFGSAGNFRYKRLFGELELEGFSVSFNKNAILDYAALDSVMDLLKRELSSKNFNLLGQADNYRQRTKEECKKISSTIAINLRKDADDEDELSEKIQVATKNAENEKIKKNDEHAIENAEKFDDFESKFEVDGEKCILLISMIKSSDAPLYAVLSDKVTREYAKQGVKSAYKCPINLSHSFFSQFKNIRNGNDYMPFITIFKSLAIAEVTDQKKGSARSSAIRMLFNQLINQ